MGPYDKPFSPQEYLMHYGVKGMKWGVRRYQNKDGTLTKAGKERYSQNQQDSDGFFSDDFFKATFNSPEVKMGRKKSGQAVLDTLSQTGDGSYGNLTVAWKLGGKHSLFWKNEGGRTRIYDGQSGEEITQSPSKARSFMDFVNMKTITYNRLDNCEPTTYALAAVERPKKT